MLSSVKRIWPIVVEELRATVRGFVDFYRGFFGYLIPERAGVLTWLPVGVVAAVTIFYAYWVSMLEPRYQTVAWIVLGGVGVAYFVASLVYIRRTIPRSWAISNILASLTVIISLIIVFAHPVFPGWLKIVAAVAVMVGAIQVARKRISEKRTGSAERRAQVRGAIIALLPFYLLAFVNLSWGINQQFTDALRSADFPAKDRTPAYVSLYEGRKTDMFSDEEFVPLPVFAGTGVEGNPLKDERITDNIKGIDFWAYGFKRVFGIALEDPIEVFHQVIVHPLATLLGVELASPSRFGVGRVTTWHPLMDIKQALLGILTGMFFIGIVAELALTIQRRYETGEADIDLTQDHGVALLAGANGLGSLSEANAVHRSAKMLRRIRERALERLTQRLDHEQLRVRQSAAFALGMIEASEAADALVLRYREEESVRVKAAVLVALSRAAPVKALAPLREALRGKDKDVMLACTALYALEDLVTRVLEPGAEEQAMRGFNHDPVELDEITVREFREARLYKRLRSGLRGLLIDCVDLAEDDLRESVVALLTRMSEDRVGAEVLEKLYATPQRSVRWRQGALLVLGRLQWAKGEDALVEYARHDAPTLRVAALKGLAHGSSAESLEILREATDAERPEARRAAFTSLAMRAGKPELPLLLQGLNDLDEQARILAARALGKVLRNMREREEETPEEVFQALATIAGDKQDSILRDEASFALAEIGDPRARGILEANLPDPEAAIALGMLGDTQAIQPLYDAAMAMQDQPLGSLKRLAPIQALGQLGAEASRSLQELYLLRAAQPDNEVDCRALSEALAECGDEGSVRFLLELFNARDRRTASYLAPALARTNHPDAKQRLLASLTAPAGPLVIRALAQTQDPEVVPLLLPLMNHPDAEIREATLYTIGRFSADPASADQTMSSMRTTLRSMGTHAVSLLRFVGRVTGNLLASDEEQEDSSSHAADKPRPRAEDVMLEFG